MNYTDIFNTRGASYNSAHILCPAARKNERQILLDLLEIEPDDIVIDAPAGGGYVAEALEGRVAQIYCIEPSAEFAKSMPSYWRIYSCPIYHTPLPAACANKYASLAGLHHLTSEELDATFKEAYRLLRSHGILAVADVKANSPQAAFLNGPVDRYTKTGHNGIFFSEGKLSQLMQSAGFRETKEEYRQFDWIFDDDTHMVLFVKQLFGMINATIEQVAQAIRQTLETKTVNGKTTLTWGLVYASGIR